MTKTPSYELGKAYEEIVDRLYIIAEKAGMGDDWVKETASDIQSQVQKKSNIDLEDF